MKNLNSSSVAPSQSLIAQERWFSIKNHTTQVLKVTLSEDSTEWRWSESWFNWRVLENWYDKHSVTALRCRCVFLDLSHFCDGAAVMTTRWHLGRSWSSNYRRVQCLNLRSSSTTAGVLIPRINYWTVQTAQVPNFDRLLPNAWQNNNRQTICEHKNFSTSSESSSSGSAECPPTRRSTQCRHQVRT